MLSVRQEPASKRADFGIVGFEEKKHTTYLVFPKPLTAFVDTRVIGIKYDVVANSSVVASNAPRSMKIPKAKIRKPSRAASQRSQPVAIESPKKSEPPTPKRTKPEPKEFRVRVRLTVVTEKDVGVQAMTKAEAKEKAESAVESEGRCVS